MYRNLDRRVEAVFPVTAPDLVKRVRKEILDAYLRDNQKARAMDAAGRYHRVRRGGRARVVNCQEQLLDLARKE